LSIRWTIPGRATPPIPDKLPRAMMEQRIDQGAVEIARCRMDDQPGGLVDHDQMLVLEDDVERDILRLVVRRVGSGTAMLNSAPPGAFLAGSRARPSGPVTAPLEISALRRSRESAGSASASARSSRQPFAASEIRASSVVTPRSIL
jgi:hypothetical protein